MEDEEKYVIFTIKDNKPHLIDFKHTLSECDDYIWDWIQLYGGNIHYCNIEDYEEFSKMVAGKLCL